MAFIIWLPACAPQQSGPYTTQPSFPPPELLLVYHCLLSYMQRPARALFADLHIPTISRASPVQRLQYILKVALTSHASCLSIKHMIVLTRDFTFVLPSTTRNKTGYCTKTSEYFAFVLQLAHALMKKYANVPHMRCIEQCAWHCTCVHHCDNMRAGVETHLVEARDVWQRWQPKQGPVPQRDLGSAIPSSLANMRV